MDGWMDGWMDGCMYVCMYVCNYIILTPDPPFRHRDSNQLSRLELEVPGAQRCRGQESFWSLQLVDFRERHVGVLNSDNPKP